MNIRVATPAAADASTAICVPMVVNTSIPFERVPPSVEEMRSRIVKSLKELPWLVCDDEPGAVAGCVYAGKHRERPAYKWSVDVMAHVREDCRGQAVGKRLYQALFTELSVLGCCQAFACMALPATRASRCMNRWASC